MRINHAGISHFFGGLYTWIITVFFGMILLDIVYSNQVPDAVIEYAEVSDFLLLIGGLTILTAIGAIVLSWKSSIARNFFIASLAMVSLEFLGPLFFSQLIEATQGSLSPTIIRLMISGSASILAFIGLRNLYRYSPLK